ncbi:response regulator transcription factor [Alloiococcus sp. CFN-8]|uniref:response regulator transcription factor n=1 Tax=Alloiococcus sp. CFN-8 TaxID=3416081 RepID=UPI003CE68629
MDSILVVGSDKQLRSEVIDVINISSVPVSVIIECSNGEKALEVLKSQKIDLMIIEVELPVKDGISVVSGIKEHKFKPQIIAVSGRDDFSSAVKLMRLGVRDYLLKPLDKKMLLNLLEKLNIEIEENKRNNKDILMLGYQLLKYLIVNDNLTSKEMEVVINQFNHKLFSSGYFLFCVEARENEQNKYKHLIYLKNIEGNDVFIISKENKDFLLKNELRKRKVGISREHTGIGELKIAYLEAKTARRSAFISGSHKVEYHEAEVKAITHYDKAYFLESDHLAQLIGTEKLEEALNTLEKAVEAVKAGVYPIEVFKESIENLINAITETYHNIIEEEDSLSLFKNIYGFSTINSFLEAFTEWIIALNRKIKQQHDDYKNKRKIQEAIAYIQDNFNKNLNMAVVSNEISMNYSLFSYLFKQYTGNNFVNYLKELRIKEAKRMLIETDLKVNQISQSIGYENEKHFMKIFKTSCGVSPTEYRKNMQFL